MVLVGIHGKFEYAAASLRHVCKHKEGVPLVFVITQKSFSFVSLSVPLKSISVQLQIKDHVASVSSCLQYVNEEEDPLEAVFVFPLPADAAVCHFSAKIAEQEIVAEVQDRQSVSPDRQSLLWHHSATFAPPFQNLQNVNYFTKIRGIIQNACYCLFSTDLNNIFHIKDIYI